MILILSAAYRMIQMESSTRNSNSNLSIYKYYTFKVLRNQHHISYKNICKLFNTVYLIHWVLKHSVNNSLLNNNTFEVEIRKEN
jgi:hypothetical protein